MDYIFHARITWYQYLYLILLGVLIFFLLENRHIPLAIGCMLLFILLIERMAHTTYMLTTNGQLTISSGRFTKSKTIRIKDIQSIEKRSSVKIAGFSVLNYILIGYNSGQYISVLPAKEQEFIHTLEKIKTLDTNNK